MDSLELTEKMNTETRTVVFLPFRALTWECFAEVFEEEKEKPDTKILVLPIAYYKKNLDGSIGEPCEDVGEYPAELVLAGAGKNSGEPLTGEPGINSVESPRPEPRTHHAKIVYGNANDYDLAALHPDVIYINNPYDDDNIARSVDPVYYAENLKNCTDRLIYIPYFKTSEIDRTNERARLGMESYVFSPGVIHADEVVLSSESLRDAYVEFLVMGAGEESREIWEKKIRVFSGDKEVQNATLETERKRRIDCLPQEVRDKLFRSDGSAKKILLYKVTMSSLLEYGEKTLDKIRRVMATFEENSGDIAVVWVPDTRMETLVQKEKPGLWQAFATTVGEYEAKDFLVLDRKNTLAAEQFCDAYYGDADGIVSVCRQRGVPVMIADVEI